MAKEQIHAAAAKQGRKNARSLKSTAKIKQTEKKSNIALNVMTFHALN